MLWNDPATGVMRHADAGYDDRDRLRAGEGARPARHSRLTAVRLIREASLPRRPWKNGGGTTVEIAVFPAGAGFDGFDWRLSMADVVADGPFSAFPDIDRTLVLIDGPGLVLDVAGEPHRLDAARTHAVVSAAMSRPSGACSAARFVTST